MTDSSTGGYLVPSSTAPIEDDPLTDFMQTVVVGITGIAGQFVRPRWQPEPPNLPDFGTDWAAIGITDQKADTYPYIAHASAANGSDQMQRHEDFSLYCTFYGPNAQAKAGLLCDGLSIAQNREAMGLVGIKLVACGPRLQVPELIKERWRRKIDVTLAFRRELDRTYPVLNLLSSAGNITAGNITTPFDAL